MLLVTIFLGLALFQIYLQSVHQSFELILFGIAGRWNVVPNHIMKFMLM